MRARAAFERSHPGMWSLALQGDQEALKAVTAWLACDGVLADSLRVVTTDEMTLCLALAKLSEARFGINLVKSAQILAAKFGDFSRVELGGQLGVAWYSQRAPNGAKSCNLFGDRFEAWRVIVKHGRSKAPEPDELILAPLVTSDKPWTARAIRQAIARGVKETSKRATQQLRTA